MYFVERLTRIQKEYDSIWIVVGRLTKPANFILINILAIRPKDYEKIFIDDIVCRHGILLSIISDRGAQLTSRFLRFSKKGWVPS